MSEMQIIQSAVQQAAKRRRSARGLRGLWVGLLVGAVISLLAIGLYHIFPLPPWTPLAAALAPFPCLLIGWMIGFWRKPAFSEMARWLDGRQHLQERLSTALEVAKEPETSTWRQLVVTDAAQHAKGLDPRRLMPFSLPKSMRWALVVLALCVGLGFVPEYRSAGYKQRKADEQVIKEVGKQLADLTRRSLE